MLLAVGICDTVLAVEMKNIHRESDIVKKGIPPSDNTSKLAVVVEEYVFGWRNKPVDSTNEILYK